jgi:hypothetical protein
MTVVLGALKLSELAVVGSVFAELPIFGGCTSVVVE